MQSRHQWGITALVMADCFPKNDLKHSFWSCNRMKSWLWVLWACSHFHSPPPPARSTPSMAFCMALGHWASCLLQSSGTREEWLYESAGFGESLVHSMPGRVIWQHQESGWPACRGNSNNQLPVLWAGTWITPVHCSQLYIYTNYIYIFSHLDCACTQKRLRVRFYIWFIYRAVVAVSIDLKSKPCIKRHSYDSWRGLGH